MRLSLVLATVGRADDVGRLVTSLARQTLGDFELLVIDQNTDDRLQPYVLQAQRAGLAVQHLRMQPPNLSAARNLGIDKAQGDVIGFPDDDCWYEPGVVEAVKAAFLAHPDWQGMVAHWVEQSAAEGGAPPDTLLSSAQWRRFRGGNASSITLFLRADLLRRLGGFDTRLGVGQWFGAGEETDLVLAALAAGANIGRCSSARVHHRFAPAEQALAATPWRAMLRRARGTGALYTKHRLPLAVVLRGFAAPVLKGLWPWRGRHALAVALATSVGRLQGAWAWRFRRAR